MKYLITLSMIAFTFSACTTSKLVLPNHLQFGQSRDSLIKTIGPDFREIDDYVPFRNMDYGMGNIKTDSFATNSFDTYLYDNKLAALHLTYYYYTSPAINAAQIFELMKAKYGNPDDSFGLRLREWGYNWKFSGGDRIVMEVKRYWYRHDYISIYYRHKIAPESDNALLKKLLERSGPMQQWIKTPTDKKALQNVLDHYRPPGNDSAVNADLHFSFQAIDSTPAFPYYDSIVLFSKKRIRKISGPESLAEKEIQLTGLQPGRYSVKLYTRHYVLDMTHIPFIICTGCPNKTEVKIKVLKPDPYDENKIYNDVAFAYYSTSNETSQDILRSDFFNALTDKELNLIVDKDFVVKAVYSKSYVLADIMIQSQTLTKKERAIVLKGFAGLQKWKFENRRNIPVESIIKSEDIWKE